MSEWNLGLWLVFTACVKNVLCFLLLGNLVHKKQKDDTWLGVHLQKMWMTSRQVELGLWCDQVKTQGIEGRTSFNFCSMKPLLSTFSTTNVPHVMFCFLSFRLQEDTFQRLKTDFWVLHRKKSSAIVKPRFMKCCKRKEDGVEWVWINQLSFLWGSKTSEKRQMLILWMWLKKTGKENPAVQCKIL